MIDTQTEINGSGSEADSVTVKDLLDVTERIMDLDERRQEALRTDIESDTDGFVETRDVLEEQRQELARLERYLSAERDHLSELVEGTDHLSVNQAVRHRDQSIEKIREHNETLSRFHEEMDGLLAVVETNLERIETEGEDADLEDSREHLEAAIDAIRDHNDSIDGLDTNLRILQAYLG